MFDSRPLNNKTNSVHERCLWVLYNDKQSNFEELLHQDNSISIHLRNLLALATEMYETSNGILPEIMNEIVRLQGQSTHNFTHISLFTIPIATAVLYET